MNTFRIYIDDKAVTAVKGEILKVFVDDGSVHHVIPQIPPRFSYVDEEGKCTSFFDEHNDGICLRCGKKRDDHSKKYK
jgi:hypothetical protein